MLNKLLIKPTEFMDSCDVTCIVVLCQLCYKALVKPTLVYAAIVWSPYIQKDIDKAEQVCTEVCSKIYF